MKSNGIPFTVLLTSSFIPLKIKLARDEKRERCPTDCLIVDKVVVFSKAFQNGGCIVNRGHSAIKARKRKPTSP